MTETTQPDPKVVACPDCDAPAGEPCRNDRGAAVAWIHLGRRDRALEPQPLTVADGTGPLIEAILRRLDGEDVPLRGEVWRASIAGPYALTLTQWADSSERGEPTGPTVRVTFTVHVEEMP